MSLINLNLGAVFSGVVRLERPLIPGSATMPLCGALFQAVIDKSYLAWVNLEELVKNFPTRVSIVNDTVTLEGPVLIIPVVSALRKHVTQAFGAVGLTLLFSAVIYAIQDPKNEGEKAKALNFSVGLAFLMSAGTVYAATQLLSKSVGIHFLKS